ncbi:MAG: hypothetical protein LBT47_05745 [Deltaproteobacteria bacterium]|jgi:hypothetical protein|nr:hypothetical protein [Deltaproteobacteria bacterium]
MFTDLSKKVKNKKLRKLLQNPKQFFRDMKVFAGFRPKKPSAPSVVPIHQPSSNHRFSALSHFNIYAGKGGDPAKSQDPIIFVWGMDNKTFSYFFKCFDDYSYALPCDPKKLNYCIKQLEAFCINNWERVRFLFWEKYAHPELKILIDTYLMPCQYAAKGPIYNHFSPDAHRLSFVVDDVPDTFQNFERSQLAALLNTHDLSSSKFDREATLKILQLFTDLELTKNKALEPAKPTIKKWNLAGAQVIILEARMTLATLKELVAAVEGQGHTNLRFYYPPDEKGQIAQEIFDFLQSFENALIADTPPPHIFKEGPDIWVHVSYYGFEALLYGCQVFTIGRPFYSGWGLTHDYGPILNRERKLSLEELFHIYTHLYAKYFLAHAHPSTGLMSSMLLQKVDYDNSGVAFYLKRISDGKFDGLLERSFWPLAINPDQFPKVYARYKKDFFKRIFAQDLFKTEIDELFKFSLCLYLYCLAQKVKCTDDYLEALETGCPELLERVHFFTQALVDPDLDGPGIEGQCEVAGLNIGAAFYKHHRTLRLLLLNKEQKKLTDLAVGFFRDRRHTESYLYWNVILLSSVDSPSFFAFFNNLISLASRLGRNIGISSFGHFFAIAFNKNITGPSLEMQGRTAANCTDNGLLTFLAKAYYRFNYSVNLYRFDDKLTQRYGPWPWYDILLAPSLAFPDPNPLPRVRSLLNASRTEEALSLLKETKPSSSQVCQYLCLLSETHRLRLSYAESQRIMIDVLATYKSAMSYNEALFAWQGCGDVDWGQEMIREFEKSNAQVDHHMYYCLLFNLGFLKKALYYKKKAPYFSEIVHYFPNSFIFSMDELNVFQKKAVNILVVAEWSPADQIIFAGLYNYMLNQFPDKKFTILCDERLYDLFKRSFPELNLLPTCQAGDANNVAEHSKFDKLPGRDCYKYFDNRGYEAACKADAVISVMSLMADTLPDEEHWDWVEKVTPDGEKRAFWKKRLDELGGNPKVGLCWRTGLSNAFRDSVSFTVEDMAPILECDSVQFVNCQYAGLSKDEEAFLDRHFPGRLFTPADLDQFNDIDGSAALYSNLDLMISISNYVSFLSSALGIKTWIFSPLNVAFCFISPGTKTSLLYKDTEYIFGEQREKKEIIKSLAHKLKEHFGIH